jgi:GDP/UDP-N,N'-diacetylbacillosamine 2-epimerase (hydrolysing)
MGSSPKMKRHIAVLTGKRGGYGAMKPMLHLIDDDPDLHLSLVVTDQHLNPKFGETITEVEKEFNVAAKVEMDQSDDTGLKRSQALGQCLSNMAETLDHLRPDILVLYGDRGEVLVSATAALHMGIPVAHLQGGDLSGNTDELMRHSITKLSHLHFPSTQESADRIQGMGEDAERIHVVGDNHVDAIVAGCYLAPEKAREQYSIAEGENPIIVLYHPETTRVRNHYEDMCGILDAVLSRKKRTLIIYPCSDAGYDGVVKAIKQFQDMPNVTTHQNIEAPDFWGLMAIADVFVGNSSAGLIETPYFGLPAINIGERQLGRKHSENLTHCGISSIEVSRALETTLNDEVFRGIAQNCTLPFGNGMAGSRIVDVLKNVKVDANLTNKRMTY